MPHPQYTRLTFLMPARACRRADSSLRPARPQRDTDVPVTAPQRPVTGPVTPRNPVSLLESHISRDTELSVTGSDGVTGPYWIIFVLASAWLFHACVNQIQRYGQHDPVTPVTRPFRPQSTIGGGMQ